MIPISAASALLGISEARTRLLCQQRRIKGARKIGRDWWLPVNPIVTPKSHGPRGAWATKE